MALFRSPVPQILLSRNALYTSPEFYSDAWARKQWGLWLRTHIQGLFAKWSIPVSDRVVAPSGAFAVEIRAWLDGRSPTICTIPHGFDRTLFFGDDRPLPEEMQRLLSQDESCLRLLFVSHYNYFRNFDTLVRALPLIKKRLEGRCIKLILTCRLRPAAGRGRYDVSQTRELVRRLGVGGDIMELDQVPYPLLHKVYRACDMYVTPSYAESFAHPLVEAMACGLPVVASDLAVHREVCADAALYFPRFSPECLAEQVAGIAGSRDLAREMAVRGLARSRNFSWKKHVSELVALAAQLVDGCRPANPPVVNREIEAAAMQTPACTAEGQRK
jgi:glycosyltransferase involved in cell wall biosynthesis